MRNRTQDLIDGLVPPSEQDIEARLEMYRQAEPRLTDDAAAIFLAYSPTDYMLVKPHMAGCRGTPFGVAHHIYLSIVEP